MTALRIPVGEADWSDGPATAPVTLVQYGDFECPFCGRAYWVVKRLQRDHGNDLRFVFRHFPLTRTHPNAMQSAEAAEAAGAQGQFWQMHGLLYEHQQQLEAPALLAYGAELGLDLPQFSQELQDHRHRSKIRRSFIDGVRSGVNGTPTFFINGERYDGPYSLPTAIGLALGQPISAAEPAPPGW